MFDRLKSAVATIKIARRLARGGMKISGVASAVQLFSGLFSGMRLSEFRDYSSYLEASCRKVWALWKGCDIIAKVLMDTPWKLTRRDVNGKPIEVRLPALETLFRTPNQYETWGQLVYRWVFHMLVTGNAFLIKDQPTILGTKPRGLFLANPKRMRLVPGPDLNVLGYIYTGPQGIQIPLDLNEVTHFRIPNADNEFWGLGAVQSAEPLFNDFINRATWTNEFWENGAAPSGILICKDQISDQETWEKAKIKWQKEYGGSGNSGKTAWLTGDWSYQQIGLTAQEMEHIETSKWSVTQIFMQLGVPLSVTGIQGAANRATAEVDDLRFRRYTIKPLLRFLQETMNADIVNGFAQGVELTFDLAGLIDLEGIANSIQPLFDRGVVSPNEIRDMIGLPKKDDPTFDQHYVLSTLVPVELAGINPPPPPELAATLAQQGGIANGKPPGRASRNGVPGSLEQAVSRTNRIQ
jgi:HK97 family phage portal protein